MNKQKIIAIFYALLAAAFYAINFPTAKLLLQNVPPTLMASFLYFGAGAGIGILYLFGIRNQNKNNEKISRKTYLFWLL